MGEYTTIDSMSVNIPSGTDQLSQADDHMRGIKTAVKNTFPNVDVIVTATSAELNSLDGFDSGVSTIEDRFDAIETILGNVDADEMRQLDGIDISGGNIEQRLDELETTLSQTTFQELQGLNDYDYLATGTIAVQFQSVWDRILEMQSSTITPSIDTLASSVNLNYSWIIERNGKLTHDQADAVSTYLGTTLPLGYYKNDLGLDFQLAASKIENLEKIVTGGPATGVVTWKNLFGNLLSGSGGINVTNTQGSKDRWGCFITGLYPGTSIDFQFYSDGQFGDPCSKVNDSKLVKVSPSGEAHLDISLGGLNDLFGIPGNRIDCTDNKTGVLRIFYFPASENASTREYEDVNVQYYVDDQIVPPA